MRIAVAIKQILDPAGITVNRRRERIFTNREEYIINPTDRRALETALRLKDELGAKVIAVSLGLARADDALREALAMGADFAYLLSDPAFEAADAAAVARALARAIDMLGGCDLVLAGQSSADTGSGEIAGRLAEFLGIPQVTEALTVSIAGNTAEIARTWDGEPVTVAVELPALVAMSDAAPPARYPHGARIMNAYREWDVTTWTAGDLGMSEDDLSPIVEGRGLSYPPERERGAIVSGAPEEAAGAVLALLRSRRLL